MIGKKELKVLLCIFTISVVIRIIVVLNVTVHLFTPDETLYYNVARSIFQSGAINFRNQPVCFYNNLYPLLMAPAFLFKDLLEPYIVMKIMGCIWISTAIIPVFLLASKLLKSRVHIYIATIFSIIIPEMFYTLYTTGDCIFYPLFIWYFYILYLEIENCKNKKINLMLPILLFMLYFAKKASLSLVLSFAIFFAFLIIRQRGQERKVLLKKVLIYLAVFAGLTFLLNELSGFVQGIPEGLVTNDLYADKLKFELGSELISNVLYFFNYYFIYLVIALGFTPALLPLTAITGDLKDKFAQYNLYVYLSFIVYLGVIMLTIVSFELNPAGNDMRVHYRYLFGFAPIFFINLLRSIEEERSLNWIFKLVITYLVSVTAIYGLKNLEYMAIADSPNLVSLYVMFEEFTHPEMLLKVIILFITLSFFVVFQEQIYKNLRWVMVLTPMVFACINSFVYVSVPRQVEIHDFVELANILDDSVQPEEEILLVGEHTFENSISTLDIYLDKEPYFLSFNQLSKYGGRMSDYIPYDEWTTVGMNELKDIKYVALPGNASMASGEVIATLEDISIIKMDTESPKLSYYSTQTYSDGWVSEHAGYIRIFRDELSSENLKFILNNEYFGEGIDIKLSTQHDEVTKKIPLGTDSVELSHQWGEEEFVDVFLETSGFVIPSQLDLNSDDDRVVSVKLEKITRQ